MTDPVRTETIAFTSWPDAYANRYRKSGLWSGDQIFDWLFTGDRQRSKKLAIASGNVHLSYAELFEQSVRISNALHHHGLSQGDRVLIQLGNSEYFVTVLLACLRIGVHPVLALPAHREHEIGHLVEFSNCKAIIIPTDNDSFDYLSMALSIKTRSSSLKHIFVKQVREPDLHEHVTQLRASSEFDSLTDKCEEIAKRISPNDVALYLLSGGTTGLPKLIPRTHNDYIYNVKISSTIARIDEQTVYLVALPAAHNFPLACPGILGTLFAGGRVIMAKSPAPNVVFPLIEQHSVTTTAVVPAVAMRWLDEDLSRWKLSSLQVLQVGGSRMPPETAQRVRPMLGCKLQQVFGMAEGLLNFTRLEDSNDTVCETQGRPASGADEIRVIDENGDDVEPGGVGELLTRGPYTIRGYFKAPEHNARSFTADGYYCTGDLVILRADGNLVVQGRNKDVINRGGEKISAEEIENLCLSHQHIKSVAAVSMPDAELGENICVYAVATHPEALELGDLQQHLLEKNIARFKLPQKLVLLPELPVTSVGKIDKKRLREDAADSFSK